MSTIKGIFEPFYEYVQDQLETRKKIIGSAKRDSKFFKVYTERQCVIRMASGVDLRLDNDILEPGEEYLTQKNVKGSYSGLARQYILEGGTQFYNLGGGFGGTREGFTQKRNTPKTGHSYGDRNVRANAQDGFGIVPMPGILNAEVTTKSQEGSLREARITYVCFNKRQLEVLEALYMRPGYPVLLEWGWVPYINEDGEIEGYYYFHDWSKLKSSDEPKRIAAFGFGNGTEPEIKMCKKYVSGYDYYCPVDYAGGLCYAELESEVSDYLINDVQNGFSGTKVVNFNNGVPDKEKQLQVKNDVMRKLTGSRGEKVVIAFNNNAESKTTVDDIPLNDAPQHYEYLSNECSNKLIVAHRVTSPLLLGIRTENNGLG